jgi:hypothetical protein
MQVLIQFLAQSHQQAVENHKVHILPGNAGGSGAGGGGGTSVTATVAVQES